MKFLDAIKNWWQGTYIPEPPNSPLILGCYDKHWTSQFVHSLLKFYLEHWKWLWPFLVGLLGVAIAIFKN